MVKEEGIALLYHLVSLTDFVAKEPIACVSCLAAII
jgi:hypothetical protein